MPWQPIDQLAAAEQKLGTAKEHYTYSFMHYLFRLGQCGGGVLFGLLWVFIGFQMTREGWAFPLLCLVIGLAILAGCGYLIYLTLGWTHLRVKVFPAGLLRIERDRFIVLFWGQVESVWQEITIYLDNIPFLPGRKTHVYTIKLTNGDKVVFKDNIGDVAGLGETIEDETSRRLLPLALKKYNEGGSVVFGSWSVSQAGLKYGSKTLPWETIGNVEVLNGILLVNQKGKFLPVGTDKASKIPNLCVFFDLITTLRGDTAEA